MPTSPTPTWRPAEPTDDDAIVLLCMALFREDPSPHAPSPDHARRTLAAYRAQPVRGRAVVLDGADGVVGYAFLASFWSNELGGEVCVIDELYVGARARPRPRLDLVAHPRRAAGRVVARRCGRARARDHAREPPRACAVPAARVPRQERAAAPGAGRRRRRPRSLTRDHHAARRPRPSGVDARHDEVGWPAPHVGRADDLDSQ